MKIRMNDRSVLRLNRRQLRRIINEVAGVHGLEHTIDEIVHATVAQMAEHLDGGQALDAVTAAVLSTIPDDQMARPVRYEDVDHYAEEITRDVLAGLHDDVHRFASMVIRTFMEPER